MKCVIRVEILSKSKLEKCKKTSESDKLNCNKKFILNMVVSSETVGEFCLFDSSAKYLFFPLICCIYWYSFAWIWHVSCFQSGREASIVAKLVELEENTILKMQTVQIPLVITVNKFALYALYGITYIRVCILARWLINMLLLEPSAINLLNVYSLNMLVEFLE